MSYRKQTVLNKLVLYIITSILMDLRNVNEQNTFALKNTSMSVDYISHKGPSG
jgi:hypothetical protein